MLVLLTDYDRVVPIDLRDPAGAQLPMRIVKDRAHGLSEARTQHTEPTEVEEVTEELEIGNRAHQIHDREDTSHPLPSSGPTTAATAGMIPSGQVGGRPPPDSDRLSR